MTTRVRQPRPDRTGAGSPQADSALEQVTAKKWCGLQDNKRSDFTKWQAHDYGGD